MTASLGLSRRRMTPSPPTVSSSHSRKWISITTQFATGGRWFPPAAANPTRSGPTSPSSVPTGVSSVTISSSISLRRRAEPETGQPGSRICESRSPIRETEPPEIASARSSSRRIACRTTTRRSDFCCRSVSDRERERRPRGCSDVHQYGGGVAVKPDGDLIGVHPRQRIPRPCPTATNTASPYAPNPPGEPRRQAGRCPDHRSRRSRE